MPERPAADRGGHLQPPQAGHPARHRRDDALRAEQLDAAAEAVRAAARLAVQHAHAHRACRRRRSATRAWRRCEAAAHPAQRRLPLLRRQAVRQRRARLLVDRRRSSSATSRPTTQARAARRQGPVALLSADAPPRRPRLAGRAQPLAGDAQRRAARRSGSPTGATSCCRSRRSCSPRRCARCRRAGFVGANVTIPHKEAALALADEATAPARAIGAANTLTLRPGGAIARRQHRRARPARRAAGDAAARGRALVLGAGGSARAAVWALREAGADGRGLEPHARAGAGAGRRARRRAPSTRRRRRRPARQLHVGRACSRTSQPFKELPAGRRCPRGYAVRRRPRLPAGRHGAPAPRGARGCATCRRPGGPGPPGRAELRALDRQPGAVDVMRRPPRELATAQLDVTPSRHPTCSPAGPASTEGGTARRTRAPDDPGTASRQPRRRGGRRRAS